MRFTYILSLDSVPIPKVLTINQVFNPDALFREIETRKAEASGFAESRKGKGEFQGQGKVNNDGNILGLALELHHSGDLLSDKNVSIVSRIFPSIQRAAKVSNTMAFSLRNLWQAIMMTVHSMWLFVDKVRELIPDAFDEQADDVPKWLHRLVGDYDNAIRNWDEKQLRAWCRKAYTSIGKDGDTIAKVAFPSRDLSNSEKTQERHQFIESTICDKILPKWFQLPTISSGDVQRGNRSDNLCDWMFQGRLVDILISISGGTDVLLLDGVRACFQNIRKLVLGVDARDRIEEAHWETVDKALSDAFAEGSCTGKAITDHASICKAVLPNSLITTQSLYPEFDEPGSAIQHRIKAAASVATFLKDLMPLLGTLYLETSTKLANMIHSDNSTSNSRMVRHARGDAIYFKDDQLRVRHQDHHYPFREHAPSRKAVQVITHSQAITHAGGFSFALFRATTISTSFVLNYPYLKDWQDFKKAKAAVEARTQLSRLSPKERASAVDLHLCSMIAYGKTPNKHRNIDQARDVWAGMASWPELVAKHGDNKIPWKSAIKWVKTTKPEIPQMKGMGLTGYLFLTDLVYAGVVEEPTAIEVGHQLNSMGRGGYSCLTHFYLAPDTKRKSPARTEITIQGFAQLFEDVKAALGPEDSKTIGFNPIILEHTLCKYMRFFNNNYLQLPQTTLDMMSSRLQAHVTTPTSDSDGDVLMS